MKMVKMVKMKMKMVVGSGGNSGIPSNQAKAKAKEDTRDCGLDCQLGVIVLAPPNQGDGGNNFNGIIFLHPRVQERDSPLWFV